MWVERHTRVLHYLHTLLHILCTLHDPVYSQVDDSCDQCKDSNGDSCNEALRRFDNSKFWIMKGDKKATFDEAADQCQQYGFVMAEVNSESEQAIFEKLATSDSDMYWIGFVQMVQNGPWTKMDLVTAPAWMSPTLDEDDGFDFGGKRAIAMDAAGAWYSSASSDFDRVICQFSPASHCYKGVGKKPETPKPMVTMNSNCPEPEFEDNQLIRTGPGSKYLYPKSPYFTSSAEATTLCTKLDLDPATILGKFEYKHVVNFGFAKLNNTRLNFKVNLGGVNTGSGIYEYLNQEPPMNDLKFQAFNLQQREYFASDADCLAIEWFRSYHFFIPVPCSKKQEVMPLCQYRANAACAVDAPLALQDDDLELNKLLQIGGTEKYNYFGAMKQKKWDEALRVCNENKLKLLTIHKGQPGESKEILKIANEYRTSLGMSAWSGYSWISDKFQDNEDLMKELNKTGWMLNDNLTVDRNLEKCFVLTIDGIRPVICDLPNYFLCYSARLRPTTPPTTAVPANDSVTTNNSAMARASGATEKPEECFFGLKMKISFPSDGLLKDDMLGLIKTSIALKFSEAVVDTSLGVKAKSRWRIPHVKAMGELTKTICPESYVMPEFIHLLTNYIMIYYNSIQEPTLPEDRVAFWGNAEKKYAQCQNSSEKLKFTSSGGLITEFEGPGGNVNIANETADVFPVLDYMLEGLWFMFELTAVSCYKSPGTKILWLSNYFTYFRKDFTDMFKKWWVSPGENNYGVLFGDMDLYQNLYNLRACAVACYQNQDAEDLLLVRPVDIADETYVAKSINKRTA